MSLIQHFKCLYCCSAFINRTISCKVLTFCMKNTGFVIVIFWCIFEVLWILLYCGLQYTVQSFKRLLRINDFLQDALENKFAFFFLKVKLLHCLWTATFCIFCSHPEVPVHIFCARGNILHYTYPRNSRKLNKSTSVEWIALLPNFEEANIVFSNTQNAFSR